MKFRNLLMLILIALGQSGFAESSKLLGAWKLYSMDDTYQALVFFPTPHASGLGKRYFSVTLGELCFPGRDCIPPGTRQAGFFTSTDSSFSLFPDDGTPTMEFKNWFGPGQIHPTRSGGADEVYFRAVGGYCLTDADCEEEVRTGLIRLPSCQAETHLRCHLEKKKCSCGT